MSKDFRNIFVQKVEIVKKKCIKVSDYDFPIFLIYFLVTSLLRPLKKWPF